MRLPHIAAALFAILQHKVANRRAPDFIVGADNPDGAYLRRWYLVPRNRVLNIYLHQFLRDDDDRALHDHPWPWCSLLLDGGYFEHTIAAGGIHSRQLRVAGSVKVSGPRRAHRIELLRWADPDPDPSDEYADDDHVDASFSLQPSAPCWTLFITGPRMRRWGFHCPQAGWVDFARFTKPGSTGETGAGCDA